MDKIRKKILIAGTVVPLALAGVFMCFVCQNITSSVTSDEAYSAYLAKGNPSEIWKESTENSQSPAFIFILKIWGKVFGDSDVALRFLSVVLVAVSIILFFHLLKRWLSLKTSTILTLVFALCPILVMLGQGINMYPLVITLIIGTTYTLDLALETKGKRYYILYIVLAAIGAMTHWAVLIFCLLHIAYFVAAKKNIFKLADFREKYLWAAQFEKTNKKPKSHTPFTALVVLSLPVVIFEIFGIIAVINREPENHTKNVMEILLSHAEEPEPTLIKLDEKEAYTYYFYSSNDYPVYCTAEWIESHNCGHNQYQVDKVDDLDKEKFWVITKNDADLNKVLSGEYRLVQAVYENQYYVVAEYQRIKS